MSDQTFLSRRTPDLAFHLWRPKSIESFYAVSTEQGVDLGTGTAVIKYDLRSGASAIHDFGAGRLPAEPVFVPASPAAGEDEGWLI
jgi:carotenoid cleavage dioxygenase-like enzyme